MAAILKVANVHFTLSGNNRLEYTGNGVVRLTASGLMIPSGANATRPSGEPGIVRYNTDSSTLEVYNNSTWSPLADFGPAFDKANSANLLAYNVGVNTNNYLISVIAGANTTVGTGANAFASATIAGANVITTAAFAKANAALPNTSGVSFNGNLYFPTGNVGIGTTTPAGKLHARYDASAGDSYTAKYIFQNTDQKLTLGTYYRSGVGQYASIDTSDSAGTGTSDLLFMTGGTERIRLLNNGNLGIGLGVPTTKLHIRRSSGANSTGEVQLDDGTQYWLFNSNTAVGYFNSMIQNRDHSIVFTDTGVETGALFIGPMSASAKGIRIDASGNVGIGISSPTSTLHVNGTTNTKNLIVNNADIIATINGANTAVGAGANAFASATIAGANVITTAAFAKANAALPNTTNVTFAGTLTVTSQFAAGLASPNHGIIGYAGAAGYGGILGYSLNQTKYCILGHNNAWAFYGAGDGYISANFYAAGNITAYYSDRRLKKDIVEIKNSLDIIRQISGVYYKQNDVAKSYGYNSEETQIGVIAQEIQKVIPQAVAPAPFDVDVVEGIEVSRSGENYLTVLPDKIIPVLIQAIKQLDERLSAIEDKLNQ